MVGPVTKPVDETRHYVCSTKQIGVSHSLTQFIRSSSRHTLAHTAHGATEQRYGGNAKGGGRQSAFMRHILYTVHQIYDTQTDEDQYFSSLHFKSQSSLGLLHNSVQCSCTLREAIHFGGLCNAYSNEA